MEDTLKALEMGAVEILIVYENLDTMRYILRVHGAESNGAENGTQTTRTTPTMTEKLGDKYYSSAVIFMSRLWFTDEKTLYLTPEQEKDKSHFTDKEVSSAKKGLIPAIFTWEQLLIMPTVSHTAPFL